MFAPKRKTKLSPKDVELDLLEKEMTDEEKASALKRRVQSFTSGDTVKCVLGGYTGPYIYGVVEKVKPTYVTVRTVDHNDLMMCSPNTISGLEHISYDEFHAAENKRFI